MKFVRIANVLKQGKPGEAVAVAGWVRTRRDAKTFSFLELGDGSCVANLQVIADAALANYGAEIAKLTTGSAVVAEGTLAQSPGKGQAMELRAAQVRVLSTAPAEYPLQKKHHGFEYLRDIAHLRPRTNTIAAVARLRSSMSFAIHSFFRERGFQYVHTPVITTSDCEGAGEQFRVTALPLENVPRDSVGGVDYAKDFFGKKAGLTVSGQLEAEIYALALSRVYTFGPTFRAENSNTPRHLAEFWMVEPEMAFAGLDDDTALAEEFVRYLIARALDDNKDDLAFFNERIDKTLLDTLRHIADTPFARVPYAEAVDVLEKANDSFEFKVCWGSDLQTEHERFLTEKAFGKPVIVYDYPKAIKAFYMKQNDDGKTVRAMDLLVPRIGELIGGSEREDRFDALSARIRELGLAEKDYWWYLDLRKYGSAPHAGFGMGFERLILLLTGLQNIREVIPFPRWPGNAEF
jgi:asparaginyl-tRNA synthetase